MTLSTRPTCYPSLLGKSQHWGTDASDGLVVTASGPQRLYHRITDLSGGILAAEPLQEALRSGAAAQTRSCHQHACHAE